MWPEGLLSSTSRASDMIPLDRSKERLFTIAQDTVARIRRELLLSIPLKVIVKRCDPRMSAKNSSMVGQQWTFKSVTLSHLPIMEWLGRPCEIPYVIFKKCGLHEAMVSMR